MSRIQNRLKAAYENVGFCSNKTWVSSSHLYQRANQELLARELKLQDDFLKAPTRNRTVRDCIPNSKLAKYADYEYNEARELCYTPDVSDVVFYYPCVFKRNCVREPWMLPEIEQLFIWLTYSRDFDLLDPMGIEELDHLDDQERLEAGLKQGCSDEVFHTLRPMIYENTQRAPGKSRYTKQKVVMQGNFEVTSVTNAKDVENIVMNMKISSVCADSKEVIEVTAPNDRESKFNIFKSPLGNYFVFENLSNVRNIPSMLKIECNAGQASKKQENSETDGENLETLSALLSDLQSWITTETTRKPSPAKVRLKSDDPAPPPQARRLYSAVLQGLTAAKTAEPESTPSEHSTDNSTPDQQQHPKPAQAKAVPVHCPSYSQSASANSVTLKNANNVRYYGNKSQAYAYEAQNGSDSAHGSRQKLPEVRQIQSRPQNTPEIYSKTSTTYATTNSYQYSNQNVHSHSGIGNGNPNSNSNSLCIPSNALLSCPYNFSHSHSSHSHYNVVNLCSNNAYGNFYPQSSNRPVPHTIRQPSPVHPLNQPIWVMQQSTQGYYPPMGTSQPLFYVSPNINMRPGQRWTHFIKPPSPQTYPNVQTQNWSQQNQNIYRNAYAAAYNAPQNLDYTNSRTKSCSKLKKPPPAVRLKADGERTTTEDSPSENSYQSGSRYGNGSSSAGRENYSVLRRERPTEVASSSVSEDLEQQALEQYRASSDNLYKELELQAAEQYEYSENWVRPPSDIAVFGGLRGIVILCC